MNVAVMDQWFKDFLLEIANKINRSNVANASKLALSRYTFRIKAKKGKHPSVYRYFCSAKVFG